jgi:hypothetical protein
MSDALQAFSFCAIGQVLLLIFLSLMRIFGTLTLFGLSLYPCFQLRLKIRMKTTFELLYQLFVQIFAEAGPTFNNFFLRFICSGRKF